MHVTPRRSADRSAARRRWATIAGLVLVLALPASAAAHASLVSSTPGQDEVLATVPASAVLTFSEALAEGSTFLVLDGTGATIATGKPDPADATVMSAALPSLSSGAYEVRWTSIAGDGDIERGSFSFTVALPSPTPPGPTPAPSESQTETPAEPSLPAGSPTAAPVATPAPTGDGGGGSGMDALVPIVAVVVLVGVGLVLVLRRRGPA